MDVKKKAAMEGGQNLYSNQYYTTIPPIIPVALETPARTPDPRLVGRAVLDGARLALEGPGDVFSDFVRDCNAQGYILLAWQDGTLVQVLNAPSISEEVVMAAYKAGRDVLEYQVALANVPADLLHAEGYA